MTILIISIATFFNIFILRWKYKHQRYTDMLIDVFVLIALGVLFGDTITGLSIATSVSALFSLYLLISPPKEFL